MNSNPQTACSERRGVGCSLFAVHGAWFAVYGLRFTHARSPRGLTLIEILIVLGIIVAIGAIVVPPVVGQLERRSFEHALDRVSGHLLLARAHAQQTGRAVEVRYHPDPPRLTAHSFEMGARPAADNLRSAIADRDTEADREVARSWARRLLPDNVDIQREMPVFLQQGANEPGGIDTWNGENGPAEAPTIRIAVFLNDGSAIFTRQFWITDQEHHAARLTVNPWTGEHEIVQSRALLEDSNLRDFDEEMIE